jgi:hypothetical protein
MEESGGVGSRRLEKREKKSREVSDSYLTVIIGYFRIRIFLFCCLEEHSRRMDNDQDASSELTACVLLIAQHIFEPEVGGSMFSRSISILQF